MEEEVVAAAVVVVAVMVAVAVVVAVRGRWVVQVSRRGKGKRGGGLFGTRVGKERQG